MNWPADRLVIVLLVGVLLQIAEGCGQRQRYQASKLPDGDQVVVVYVTASWTRGESDPSFRSQVKTLLEALRREAGQRSVALSLVGASLDMDPQEGLKYLRRIGQFDQVVVGAGWINWIAVEYFWRDHPGLPAVPQLLVLRRHVATHQNYISVGPDSLLGRFAGEQIIAYAKRERHF